MARAVRYFMIFAPAIVMSVCVELPVRAGEFVEMTAASKKSAERGVEWMLRAQNRDGGFGIDIGHGSDIGCTATAGLALFSRGDTPLQGKYRDRLARVQDFILNRVDIMPPDDITPLTNTQLQRKIGRHAHSFFAALFLSQVIGEDEELEPIRLGTDKVVVAICQSQQKDGSWGTQSWAPTLGTVMGWMSLRSSHFAGFEAEASAEKVAEKLVTDLKNTKLSPNRSSWMHTLYKNATAIRVLYAMQRHNDPAAQKAFKDVLELVNRDNTAFKQAGGEEYLSFHLITETMLQRGGDDWRRWYPTVRDKLIAAQNKDGSWTGHHCITSRVFCTACAVLVLQAPNRYLPVSEW